MKYLIAVPVFNEEKYVTRVLAEIRKYACHILLIDDGSTDRTPGLLKHLPPQHFSVITHPENRGYGQSLIDAFHWADAHGFDWVITMDCDEQHEPARIPAFVEACRRGDADIVSGSRYLQVGPGASQPPADRRSINRVITDLLNSTLHLNLLDPAVDPATNLPGLTDAFCGFKAHRTSAMMKLDLNIPGYAFPMQFWVEAAAAKLAIREIPVELIYKDTTRHFGGELDDPTSRLQHYLEVLTRQLAHVRVRAMSWENSDIVAPTHESDSCCCCGDHCD